MRMLATWTAVAALVAICAGWSNVILWMNANQALAAWVQAVGAIAAILGAAAVAGWQSAGARRALARQRLEQEQAKLEAVKQIIRRIFIVLNNAMRVIDEGSASLDLAIDQIEQVRGVIARLPVFEFPTPELVFLLLRADRDMYYAVKVVERFRLESTERRARQARVSVLRFKRRTQEARIHCDEAIAKAAKRHAADLM